MLDQLLYNSETNECNCFNEPQAMSGEYWSGVSHRLPKITFNIYVRVEHTFASTYNIDTHLGDRPPMLTQQQQIRFKQKPVENRQALISVKVICPQYLQKVAGR